MKAKKETNQDILDLSKDLQNNQVAYIQDNGKPKYVILTMDYYNHLKELLKIKDFLIDGDVDDITLQAPDNDLTYEEYEYIRNTVMDLIDRTLKPKAEKMN